MIIANITAIVNAKTDRSARDHLSAHLDDIYNNNESLVEDIWIDRIEPSTGGFSIKIIAHLLPSYDGIDEFVDILDEIKSGNPAFFNEFYVDSHSEVVSELEGDFIE